MMLKSAFSNFNMQTIGGIPVYSNNTIDGTEKYCTVDDLYSIVKRITKTAKRIPLYVYAVKDEKKHAQYKVLARHWERTKRGQDNVLQLKDDSMEIIGDNDELQKRLDFPNELYSKDEWLEGAYAYPLLNGNRYIWLDTLKEGANAGKPFGVYLLPPNYTNPKIVQGYPPQITGYELTINGMKEFKPEEIIHSRYFNPRYDISGSELIGLSPVQAMLKTITQSSAERDYTNQALQNAGANGVFTFDGSGNEAVETAGRMKAEFYKEAGPAWRDGVNYNAKKTAFILGKDAKYTQMGFSPADMEIIAQNKVTFQKMCNVYGVSDILFNNDHASTESNVKEMIKQLYTNAVLPEVHSLRDAFNKSLTPLYKDKKRHIDYDITDITELQEDATAIITRFAAAPAIRINDMYEAMGWGRLDDPAADVVLVKQGYSPLEDVATSIGNLDITGDYAGTGN